MNWITVVGICDISYEDWNGPTGDAPLNFHFINFIFQFVMDMLINDSTLFITERI